MKQLDKKILITGGGSGGHTSAAQAFIEELRSRFDNTLLKILYVGSKVGMSGEKDGRSVEQRRFEDTEIPFKAIRAGKLQRQIDSTTFKLVFGVIGGIIDSYKILKKFRPNLIFSTGGFVTVPVCLVGWLMRIPIYVHEQTAAVGLSNRIVSKFAKRIYTTFPQSNKYYGDKKTMQVGNAVRKTIFNTDGKGDAVTAIKKMLPNKSKKPILFIAGGGQGSHIISRTVRQMLNYIINDYQILIVTGDNQKYKDYDLLMKEKKKLSPKHKNSFHAVKFYSSEEAGFIFSNVDMYIGRGGANFVYEMALFKKPSIIIPIPWVTHDEQTKNAQALVDTGLGLILPEGELSAEKLLATIKKFWSKIEKNELEVNERLLKKNYKSNAVELIINDMGL